MKITRKDIANYKLLGVLLEKDRQKLADYIEKTSVLLCRESLRIQSSVPV